MDQLYQPSFEPLVYQKTMLYYQYNSHLKQNVIKKLTIRLNFSYQTQPSSRQVIDNDALNFFSY
jgi:hypothetical protein